MLSVRHNLPAKIHDGIVVETAHHLTKILCVQTESFHVADGKTLLVQKLLVSHGRHNIIKREQ